MSKNHFPMYYKVKVDVWHYLEDADAPDWMLRLVTPDGLFVNGAKLQVGDFVVKENETYTILDYQSLYNKYSLY